MVDKDVFKNKIIEELPGYNSMNEKQNPLFLADENELKAFAQKVDAWKAKKLSSNKIITEFSTSTVLQAINVPANKISIEQKVLKKINAPENVKVGKSYGHDIDVEIIKQIPQFLADPVMVFNSATASDSYVIMSETVDKKNRTIMVAMKVNEIKGNVVVNDIASSYGRNDNNFYIEQINLGNLVYQNKQKSLEWTHRAGLHLPQRMTTQGSLNVIQKEDVVNKRTSNFNLSERNIEFTENQQEFFKEIGFKNSIDSDGIPVKSSFEKTDSEGKKLLFRLSKVENEFILINGIYDSNDYEPEYFDFYKVDDLSYVSGIESSYVSGIETCLTRMTDEMNSRFSNTSLIPVDKLSRILSDYTLNRLVDVNNENDVLNSNSYSIWVDNKIYTEINNIAFKNKVSNLPAKFISENVYSSGINNIGKVLTFMIPRQLIEPAGYNISANDKNKHFLLEIQTDNNYEKVTNKDYPRLYKAKWDRTSKSYIDKTEIPLSDLDSKTISNIQYIQTMTLELIEELTEQLVESFETINCEPELWLSLIKQGADVKQALYPTTADAYLGDNLRWLIENIPEEKWNEIKEDRNFCKEIFENARDSIMNDYEFSVNPMLELAEKIEMLPEAISYCKELEKEYGADYEQAKNLKASYEKYEKIVYEKKLLNKQDFDFLENKIDRCLEELGAAGGKGAGKKSCRNRSVSGHDL